MRTPILSVRDLTTTFRTESGVFPAVDGVSFDVAPGEVLGIVGESGSGKSVTALSILGLLPDPPGRIASGSIRFDGREIIGSSRKDMRALRGPSIGMIFQEPMTSLNPVFRIGDQIIETILAHERVGLREARQRAIGLLSRVGIAMPERRLDDYPHQLSGGMRQRVMIAIALACSPRLLIADEPTTALDVTIQAQLLDLLRDIQRDTGMAVVIITHNMGVIAEFADRVLVMYAGRVAEQGPVDAVFTSPRHPYSLGLLGSTPSLERDDQRLTTIPGVLPQLSDILPGCRFAPRCARSSELCRAQKPPLTALADGQQVACFHWDAAHVEMPAVGWRTAPTGHRVPDNPHKDASEARPLVQVADLAKHYPVKDGILLPRVVGQVRAVDGVSFAIAPGETLGLVGESGCGKSTVARLLLHLIEPTGGDVRLDGSDLAALDTDALRTARRSMQIVFQDPQASLNPRMRAEDIVVETLVIQGAQRGPQLRQRARELLEMVGLSAAQARQYPHEFSGGQRQRLGIARAIAPSPRIIVCDEAVSALDVSVQAQVINLLQDLQHKWGFSYLFISHDLSVVKHISDRVAVMYLGRIVEIADKRSLYRAPVHPYTRALIASIPVAHPRLRQPRERLSGDLPSAMAPPSGCAFHTRCPHAEERCSAQAPALRTVERGREVACHFAERFLVEPVAA